MSEPRRSFVDRPLVQLTLVRFREFVREPEAVFWTFVFPILMAAGLGIAFRNRPADVLSIGVTGGQLAAPFRHGPGLSVAVVDRAAGERGLSTGKIVLLVLPGPSGGVTFRYDDTNSDARNARLLAERALERAAGLRDPIPVRDDLVREPGSRYIDFLVPGLLGMNLMGSSVWGIGFAIVDARRKKLLKRLVASPMSRAEYLLAFVLSRLLLLVAEVLAILLFAVVVFKVPVRAPGWEIAVLCVLSALCFSALGLLIASRARTVEAASGLMNFIMLPMWIFSGVFFSSERFPAMLQPFIRALPLTAVINALRSSMLQGTRLPQLWGELAIIFVCLAGSFGLALKLFRWR